MRRGFEFAVARLAEIETDEMAQLAYQSALEGGGTPISYLAACAPEDVVFPYFSMEEVEQPWSVVLKIEESGGFTVEGYGEDMETPIMSRTIGGGGGE